jgi:ABC-type glutathione transport system ATPase component
MSDSLVVETRSLTKVYRDFWGRKKKTALNALDLKIYKGEIFGLLGPNGSGKTTTIKLLLGLLFPTAGDAFVFGEPAAKVEKNERIGYLPEESYLYRFLKPKRPSTSTAACSISIPTSAESGQRNSSTSSACHRTRSGYSRSTPKACGNALAWHKLSSTTPN